MFRNPDLAQTYRLLGEQGSAPLYTGPLADQIVDAVRQPPKTQQTDLPVPRGFMTPARPGALRRRRPPADPAVRYRGYDVYGMAPSSSGGIAVGEALNILERFDLGGDDRTADALHHYLEASALAFADRGKYVGDPAYVDVPQRTLLSDRFASRAGLPDRSRTRRSPSRSRPAT